MENNKNELTLTAKLLDVIARLNERDRLVRNFGTDTALHLSEIHLIEFVGDHENRCVSDIAREKKITKGAVSQTLMRLEEKKYIAKGTDPENRSRVVVSLTEKGWTAYREHQKYHRHIDSLVSSCLDGKTPEEIKTILDFLAQLEHLL